MPHDNAEDERSRPKYPLVPPTPANPTIRVLFGVLRAVFLLVTAAAGSAITRLTLTPSFGAVPSSAAIFENYTIGYNFSAALTFAYGIYISKGDHSWSRFTVLLPVLAVFGPALQAKTLPVMIQLGPDWGPLAYSLTTLHLLVFASGLAIPDALAAAGFENIMKKWTSPKMLFLAVTLFMFLECDRLLFSACTDVLVRTGYLTPVQLWTALPLGYQCVFPWRFPVWSTMIGMMAGSFMNPHISPRTVNAALKPHNWTMLERQWSNTGYISVLDSSDNQYRVMRCDHSLLGGEWLLTSDRQQTEGWQVSEPIYAVFQMLEAVRLMDLEPQIPDSEAHALVIGLGIGTAPKALVAHGIDTTVVELDPVVHKFATKYFALPANHTAVLQDAVSWVQNEVSAPEVKKYDYIIHDVFTGGTEPLALFNAQFLSNLRSLLTPNGIIAINYAGDLALPLTTTVLNTIAHVFSASQCRIYRDSPQEKDQLPNSDSDFLNMVLFCRNAPGPITFRKPREADYLGSKSRRYYMLPKPEHEIPFPESDAGILNLGDEGKFAKEQGQSAVRHWRIMRKVVPDAVWDSW